MNGEGQPDPPLVDQDTYFVIKGPTPDDDLWVEALHRPVLARREDISVVRCKRNECSVWEVLRNPHVPTLWLREETDRFEHVHRTEEGRWLWITDSTPARVWRCSCCGDHVVVDCACRFVLDPRGGWVHRLLSDEEMKSCPTLPIEDPAFFCKQCKRK